MKRKPKKNRWTLTLFCSLAVFAILLATITIITVVTNVLLNYDVTVTFSERISEGQNLLFFVALISLTLGFVIALLTSKITMKPINNTITQINRLADGDFDARLKFGRIINKFPTVVEVTDSFNKMAEELQNTEMLRSDFINNFSHEFKTPIVSIAGFAKLLRHSDLTDEERDQYLSVIEDESMRLSYMATNVLNMTKIENQAILTDTASFNLSEQLRSCILLIEDKWTKKNLDLELDLDEYFIDANEELLKQVWINLLDNAVKFTENGGTIGVDIAPVGNGLSISVFNTGPEIPPEKQDKIFNKFYQSDESHSTHGNGIGLAMVKKIVSLHHGNVSVRSRNGVNTFTVELPLKQ